MASSLLEGAPCCGGAGLRLGNADRQGRGPRLFRTSTLCPPSDLYSRGGSRRPLWGRHAIPGFTRGRGIPDLRAGVTHPRSPASQWAGPRPSLRLQPCPSVLCVFQSSGVSPSGSSTLLTLYVGWTDSEEQRMGRKRRSPESRGTSPRSR